MTEQKGAKIDTTVCSNMHCYERAEITGDPAKPPFCENCKPKPEK